MSARIELRAAGGHIEAFVGRDPSSLCWEWYRYDGIDRISLLCASEAEAMQRAETWLRAEALRRAEMWTAVAKAEVTR